MGGVKDALRQYLVSRGTKNPDEALMGKALDFARASLSNAREWVFARKRESFTTDGTDFISLTEKFAGELGVYQTSGTDKKRLTYVTPDEYERLRLIDSARQSNLIYYTIFNNQDFYFHPLPASGITVVVVYNPDLADQDTQFAPRFEAALFAGSAYFYGAPPPDGARSWYDIFVRETEKLALRDRRASGRRPIIPLLEDEEVLASAAVAGDGW
jgi:hypothetical protein